MNPRLDAALDTTPAGSIGRGDGLPDRPRGTPVGSRDAGRSAVSEPIVMRFAAAYDAVCILGTGIAAMQLRDAPVDWRVAALSVLLGTVLGVNFLQLTGAHRLALSARLDESLGRMLLGLLAALAALIVVILLIAPTTATHGSWLAAWFAGSTALLATGRIAMDRRIRRWQSEGRLGQRIAVVGAGPVGQHLLRRLNCAGHPDVRIVGVYDDDVQSLPSRCMGHRILGSIDDLIGDIWAHGIDTVIVALPLDSERQLVETLNKLSLVPVDVRLCPASFALRLGTIAVSHIAGHTFLNVVDRPLRDWRWVAKTVEDRLVAAGVLTMIAPLLLAIAIAIKLDSPGPVLFRQKRVGFNNQLIEVWKFRTMHHAQADANGEQLTRRNDPRITRIGGFLRRTSLDELPQFLNVLRGDMSVVGPRPHATAAKAGALLYPEAVKYYDARHRVKPGITGWAQVNGWRGETDTVEQIRKRVEHDLYYIEHWSIAFDLRIILRTAIGGFTGRNAF